MDANTFQGEVLKIERLLYHVAYSSLSSAQDCSDAVQEALLRAWRKRYTLRALESFRPWMVRILMHTITDMQRKRRPALLPVEEAVPPPGIENLALHEALQALPQEMRCTIALYYLDGCSIQECARMLRVPEGTIKSRLSRARVQLRDFLTEED